MWRKQLIVWGLLSLCASAYADELEAWKPTKERDGIAVETRAIPDSKILAFKATVSITGSTDDVLAHLIDYERYPEWYAQCKTVELLDQNAAAGPVMRTVVRTPFPFPNRDTISQVSFEQMSDGIYIGLHNLPDYAEPVKGLVRMRQASGYWQLQQNGEEVLVTHSFHADPQSLVPRWIVNRFIVEGPIRTLRNLRTRVQGE